MKTCKFCQSKDIQDDALKCRHCGEWMGKSSVRQSSTSQKKQSIGRGDRWTFIICIAFIGLCLMMLVIWILIPNKVLCELPSGNQESLEKNECGDREGTIVQKYPCEYKGQNFLREYVDCSPDKDIVTLKDDSREIVSISKKELFNKECAGTDCLNFPLDFSNKDYVTENYISKEPRIFSIIFSKKPEENTIKSVFKKIKNEHDFQFGDEIRVNISNSFEDDFRFNYKYPLVVDIINNRQSAEKLVFFSIKEEDEKELDFEGGDDIFTQILQNYFNKKIETYFSNIDLNEQEIELKTFVNEGIKSINRDKEESVYMVFIIDNNVNLPSNYYGYTPDEAGCIKWKNYMDGYNQSVNYNYNACMASGDENCVRARYLSFSEYSSYYISSTTANLPEKISSNYNSSYISLKNLKIDNNPACQQEINEIYSSLFN